MGIRTPWGIAALLGVACLGEAAYIVAHRASASSPPGRDVTRPADEELARWEKRLHEEIERTGELKDKDFDNLFGDDFFRRRFDPFAEVDRVGRQIEKGLDSSERSLFKSSFHDWFAKRMDVSGVTTKVADEGKSVLVTFGVPGLDEGSAKFDVNANRIRFRYDTRKEVKKRGSDVETSERVEKVLPLPPGADPSGFEVRKGKDEITLVFHRIEHGA